MPREAFDAATGFLALHLVPDDGVRLRALREIHARLKRGAPRRHGIDHRSPVRQRRLGRFQFLYMKVTVILVFYRIPTISRTDSANQAGAAEIPPRRPPERVSLRSGLAWTVSDPTQERDVPFDPAVKGTPRAILRREHTDA